MLQKYFLDAQLCFFQFDDENFFPIFLCKVELDILTQQTKDYDVRWTEDHS